MYQARPGRSKRAEKVWGGDMEGWRGWDDYARFYDWENHQTMGRRDVRFWQRLGARTAGPVLELGCGTGRVAVPVARAGARVVGIDRSASMLDRARKRLRRAKLDGSLQLVRGDVRSLPFPDATFGLVAAPYGILQSLLDDATLDAALASAFSVLRTGGILGVDLVSDLISWAEYDRRVKLRGRAGRGETWITLIESVRQDRARGLTMFDQEFVERRGQVSRSHRFSLAFRTVSVEEMSARLERHGFRVSAVLGDYEGGPWDSRADVWLILAARP
jgi:SAM-dependent methyltransferase